MSEQPPTRDHEDDLRPQPDSGAPRWVKVFGSIAIALVILVIILLLTGHGPGRHLRGALAGHAAPLNATSVQRI